MNVIINMTINELLFIVVALKILILHKNYDIDFWAIEEKNNLFLMFIFLLHKFIITLLD